MYGEGDSAHCGQGTACMVKVTAHTVVNADNKVLVFQGKPHLIRHMPAI